MSDKLGYTPAPAGPGKDGYNTTGSEGKNAHRKSKKRQDGVGQSDSCEASAEAGWKQSDSEGAN